MRVSDWMIWLPVEQIYALLERIRIKRLQRMFKFCGERTVLSDGLYVEWPQGLTIADDVSLGRGVSIMGVGGVTIGQGSMLATRTLILTTTHDSSAPAMRETGIHRPVIIESNVWIGAGVIILPGVTIGTDAIVGAGAVVTHDVAARQIVAGVPADLLGERSLPQSQS